MSKILEHKQFRNILWDGCFQKIPEKLSREAYRQIVKQRAKIGQIVSFWTTVFTEGKS